MRKIISIFLYANSLVFVIFFWACGERNYKPDESGSGNSTEVTVRNSKIDQPKTVEGKVIKIQDGDTFTLLFDNDFDTKIRLNAIDCPEKKQAFSKRAKQELSKLIYSKHVVVKYEKKDRYGRILGNVFVEDVNVNEEMIKLGMAWHFKKYSDDPVLAKLELDARKEKIGLWAEPSPIPPWDYRENKTK